MNKNLLFALLPLTLLAACANVPLGEPFSRVELSQADKALVYIYRPYVKPSSAYGVLVVVDGLERAALPTDSYTRLFLPPGPHAFKFDWPVVSMQQGMSGVLDFEAGKSYFIKYSVDVENNYRTQTWKFKAQNIAPDTAMEEMKCCLFSPPKD